MPFISPVVGYFTTRGPFRCYCAACAKELEHDADGEKIQADRYPHNEDPCDLCGKPLTTTEAERRAKVHVDR